MGYAEHLRGLLAPLRVYRLEGGFSGAEIAAQGAALDDFAADLAVLQQEMLVATAADYGLSRYESLLPFLPESPRPVDRRRAVEALLRIDGGSFTPTRINDTVSGCGIRAAVREDGEDAATVRVSYPDVRGIPENDGRLRARIEQIIPCHLNIIYDYLFVTWLELEGYFPSWSEIEAAVATWGGAETYIESEED